MFKRATAATKYPHCNANNVHKLADRPHMSNMVWLTNVFQRMPMSQLLALLKKHLEFTGLANTYEIWYGSCG